MLGLFLAKIVELNTDYGRIESLELHSQLVDTERLNTDYGRIERCQRLYGVVTVWHR